MLDPFDIISVTAESAISVAKPVLGFVLLLIPLSFAVSMLESQEDTLIAGSGLLNCTNYSTTYEMNRCHKIQMDKITKNAKVLKAKADITKAYLGID